jgi:hypothetical protein
VAHWPSAASSLKVKVQREDGDREPKVRYNIDPRSQLF